MPNLAKFGIQRAGHLKLQDPETSMKQKSLQLVREMRGIPFFLLREYLEELGGKAVSENLVEGPFDKIFGNRLSAQFFQIFT